MSWFDITPEMLVIAITGDHALALDLTAAETRLAIDLRATADRLTKMLDDMEPMEDDYGDPW